MNRFNVLRSLAVVFMVCVSSNASTAETNKVFATPEGAVSALIAATTSKDKAALYTLFGPAGAELENPDRVQSTNELNAFTAAYRETNRLARLSETGYVLEVGTDLWPFPVPIVKKDDRWFFDTESGKDELLSRRIGQNELFTLEIIRAYVDAQRQYASKDRDGDAVLEYAQRIASSDGKADGLYWPIELNGQESPLGPMVGDAQAEGYFADKPDTEAKPQPFHGYLFKILARQGNKAPGGSFDYIINDNMIVGFALVAWPAEYRQSGVMTFIVNQQGRVYQRDLGEKTAEIVNGMTTYDPELGWELSPD
ncbi:MAG TPA: DUF2950 domain-containing protein [Verrucomicrobiae bacterium]